MTFFKLQMDGNFRFMGSNDHYSAQATDNPRILLLPKAFGST